MGIAVGLLAVAACAHHAAPVRPVAPEAGSAGLTEFDPPQCGARIFVAMGMNQKYPQRENMRIPRGDLFVDGELVDMVSRNPEVSVIDVPVGKTQLSWVPSSYDKVARSSTRQNALTLNLKDRQTAFVVMDLYDDTPQAVGLVSTRPTVEIRTEVAQASRETFAGKRVVFHRTLDMSCAQAIAGTQPSPPSAGRDTKLAATPPAPPTPMLTLPQTSDHPTELTPPSELKKSEPTQTLTLSPPSPPPPQVATRAPESPSSAPSAPSHVGPPQQAPAVAIAPLPPPAMSPSPPPAPAKALPSQQTASLPPQSAHVETQMSPPTAAPAPVPSQQTASLPATAPRVTPQPQPSAPSSNPPPPPAPAPSLPEVREAAVQAPLVFFAPSRTAYYLVSNEKGAAAYAEPHAEGPPVFTYQDEAELQVLGVSNDKRWLKVRTPDGQTGYVSAAIVTVGARAR